VVVAGQDASRRQQHNTRSFGCLGPSIYGTDTPAAFIEDAVAILAALLIVTVIP